jgi:hypothetical protein
MEAARLRQDLVVVSGGPPSPAAEKKVQNRHEDMMPKKVSGRARN